MIMHRNRLGAVLGAAALAGAVALTSCVSAAATTGTVPPRTVSTRTVRPAAARGHADIMVYSINSDGPGFRAILAGAVGDYGPAVIVGAGRSEMKLSLTRGSFRLSIAAMDKRFVRATSHEPIYPDTCSDFVSVRAAVPVVAGSGTGAYRSIRGSFTVTATLHEVEAKPCMHSNAFVWQAIIVSGPGTISLG
jgi:hypothetical protein